MTCSNCGQPAGGGDHFCARCGAPMMAMMGPAATVPVYHEAPPAVLTQPHQDSRPWAVAAHLSAFVGAFAALFGVVVGPLLIWLLRRDVDPFAAENAREALNFNLSMLLYGFALGMLTLVTFGLGVIVTVPALFVLAIAWIVLSLAGALRAWNDGVFRYPFTIRFVK